MSELSNNLENLQVGDTITGTVVKIEEKEVVIDFGYKTEGVLPTSELSNLHDQSISEEVSEGEELTLKVIKLEEDEVILSKKEIDAQQAWIKLKEKQENQSVFDVEVNEVVKGGLVVDVGLRGFIPASMVETYFVDDFSTYQGRTLSVKVIELDEESNRVILSHKAIAQAEQTIKKQNILETLKSGEVIEGTVQRITDFGVFVDLGGIDGLVHISQLAHEHVSKASDIVNVGDTIKVEVLAVDLDNGRISLSRKKVLPGPWDDLEGQLKSGQTLEGTVKRLVDFGAFVEILPGIEGLVHISEIANRHISKPNEVLSVGETVKVKVLDVNQADHRVSLSIKEVEKAATEAEYKKYQKDQDSTGFSFADVVGNQLDKYK